MILTIRFPLVYMIYTNRFLVKLETQRENYCRLRSYTSIYIHTHVYAHRHRHGQTDTDTYIHTHTPTPSRRESSCRLQLYMGWLRHSHRQTLHLGERVVVGCNHILRIYIYKHNTHLYIYPYIHIHNTCTYTHPQSRRESSCRPQSYTGCHA